MNVKHMEENFENEMVTQIKSSFEFGFRAEASASRAYPLFCSPEYVYYMLHRWNVRYRMHNVRLTF